jgi:hypothetical protein
MAKKTRSPKKNKKTIKKMLEPLLYSGTKSGCTFQAYEQLVYPNRITNQEFLDSFCAKKLSLVHWDRAAEAAAQLLGGVVATRNYGSFRECLESADRVMGGILSINGKRGIHHVVCFKNNKSGFTIYDSARYEPYDVSAHGRASSALFESSALMVVLEFPSSSKKLKTEPEVHVID